MKVSLEEARRIAVRAQLLDGSPGDVLETVRRLGFLQIDVVQPVERVVEGGRHTDAVLAMEGSDDEPSLLPLRLQVEAAHDPVAAQEGEHVVAVPPLRRGLVDLDQVVEAEDPSGERPVPEQVVEGREQHRGGRARRVQVGGRFDHDGRAAVIDGEAFEPPVRDERIDMRANRCDSTAVLLSPFDNLLWDRPFAHRVLAFEHLIEVYKPSPQRRYGYYVLPLLWRDRIVGRADLKSDRKRGVLVVKAFHREDGVRASAALERFVERALDRLRIAAGLEAVER